MSLSRLESLAYRMLGSVADAEDVVQEAPETLTDLAEQLSLGLLFVLERLSPLERVVFILRDGFDLSFDDIALMVDSSPASCRQRYRRARLHLRDEPRFPSPAATQRELLNRLMLAVAEKDSAAVVALFTDDAVVYTDGSGGGRCRLHPDAAQRCPCVAAESAGSGALHGADRCAG